MPGILFQVTVANKANDAILRIAVAGKTELLLNSIGEELLNLHQDRWRQEITPDGEKWARLSRTYAAEKAKKKPNAGILTYSGDLRRYLRYRVNGSVLEFGTNLDYGRRHHFGGKTDTGKYLRPRPWLGIGQPNEDRIQQVINDFTNTLLISIK